MITIKLDSGRSLEPSGGIIGINEELEVFEGYDSPLYSYSEKSPLRDEKLTNGERQQIANMMIDRWIQFKNKTT